MGDWVRRGSGQVSTEGNRRNGRVQRAKARAGWKRKSGRDGETYCCSQATPPSSRPAPAAPASALRRLGARVSERPPARRRGEISRWPVLRPLPPPACALCGHAAARRAAVARRRGRCARERSERATGAAPQRVRTRYGYSGSTQLFRVDMRPTCSKEHHTPGSASPLRL